MDLVKDKAGKITSMRAEYKRQAHLGDILKPVVIENKTSDNSIYTVSLNNTDGQAVCVVELIVK